MIINPYIFGGWDIDALAFINATGITDVTQKNAINTFVIDLKSANIWAKMKAIYPFVGGTAFNHKFNLKDARDLDVAYRLSFIGGWTHSNNGALGNGTTAYADTFFLPSSVYSANQFNVGVSYYKDKSTAFTNGSYDATNRFLYGSGTTSIDCRINSDSGTPFVVNYTNTGIGFFSTNRVFSFDVNAYMNGVNVGSITRTNGLSTYNSYIGARNGIGTANDYDAIEQRFVAYHEGLNNTENLAFYNAVQNFNTTLGRNV